MKSQGAVQPPALPNFHTSCLRVSSTSLSAFSEFALLDIRLQTIASDTSVRLKAYVLPESRLLLSFQMIYGSSTRFSGEARVKFRLDMGGNASRKLFCSQVVPPCRVRLVSMESESDASRRSVRG